MHENYLYYYFYYLLLLHILKIKKLFSSLMVKHEADLEDILLLYFLFYLYMKVTMIVVTHSKCTQNRELFMLNETLSQSHNSSDLFFVLILLSPYT